MKNNSAMQAMILVGGLGTRLRRVVNDVPKPMAPVGGLPFLNHLLVYLHRQGISDVILLTGYKSEVIEEYFGDGRNFGINLSYCKEEELLGTAGALRNALPLIHSQTIFVLNGDTFFPCDLSTLANFHHQRSAQATIALKLLAETARYGRVETTADYRVSAFHEKTDSSGEGYINGGIYVVERKIIENIPASRTMSLEREVFPSIDSLYALPMGERFVDIGVPKDYAAAQQLVPTELQTVKRPALFLDRDGIINRDTKYVHAIDEVEFCPGIFAFCREAQRNGYLLVVVTNQAGIARGYYSVEDAEKLHAWMREQFLNQGVTLSDILMCPYHEKGIIPEFTRASLYRKPQPGMLLEAADRLHIDLGRSIMIGDKASDRIRLPYLKSYVIKSDYTAEGWDCESLSDLRRFIPIIPVTNQ